MKGQLESQLASTNRLIAVRAALRSFPALLAVFESNDFDAPNLILAAFRTTLAALVSTPNQGQDEALKLSAKSAALSPAISIASSAVGKESVAADSAAKSARSAANAATLSSHYLVESTTRAIRRSTFAISTYSTRLSAIEAIQQDVLISRETQKQSLSSKPLWQKD
ncbi:MAG: hypothetical protein BM560_07425 [Roseobacter sp. MedPE-SWde]|nr:MAG: hypothetical protein BM560_07425 [Roseobacter sp. MedPE-SWde]